MTRSYRLSARARQTLSTYLLRERKTVFAARVEASTWPNLDGFKSRRLPKSAQSESRWSMTDGSGSRRSSRSNRSRLRNRPMVTYSFFKRRRCGIMSVTGRRASSSRSTRWSSGSQSGSGRSRICKSPRWTSWSYWTYRETFISRTLYENRLARVGQSLRT